MSTVPREEWITEAGLPAMICELSDLGGGWLAGFVGVEPLHPFYSAACDDEFGWISPAYQSIKREGGTVVCSAADYGIHLTPSLLIVVHGSLTFAGYPQADPQKNYWWFGFHMNHPGDRETGLSLDVDYVRSECESVARQLVELDKEFRDAESQGTT